jgi:Leucine Rich repeat
MRAEQEINTSCSTVRYKLSLSDHLKSSGIIEVGDGDDDDHKSQALKMLRDGSYAFFLFTPGPRIINGVTELNLKQCSLGDHGAIALSEALYWSNSVAYLSLAFNDISLPGAKAIARVLLYNTTLKDLKMGFNPLTSEGVEHLLLSIECNETLLTLDLWGIDFSDELQEKIKDINSEHHFLSYNDTLKEFYCNYLSVCDLVTGRICPASKKGYRRRSDIFSSLLSTGTTPTSGNIFN